MEERWSLNMVPDVRLDETFKLFVIFVKPKVLTRFFLRPPPHPTEASDSLSLLFLLLLPPSSFSSSPHYLPPHALLTDTRTIARTRTRTVQATERRWKRRMTETLDPVLTIRTWHG